MRLIIFTGIGRAFQCIGHRLNLCQATRPCCISKLMGFCTLCGGDVDEICPLWRWIFDLFKLYLVGVFELLRQWFASSSVQSRPCHGPRETLPAFQAVNPVILLTGCTSGIGREILRRLQAAQLDVVAITHNEVDLPMGCEQLSIDFNSRASTERGSQEVLRRLMHVGTERLAILIHCAATFHPRVSPHEKDTSVVAKTLNVNLLMPCLFINRITHLLHGIVWIGSSSQSAAPRLRNIRCPLHAAKSPFSAYPLSKLLSLAFANDWSVLNKKPVVVVHPGVVATGLYRAERGMVGRILRILIPMFAWTASSSAMRIMRLVEVGGFLDNIKGEPVGTEDPRNSNGVYWDTVRMGRGALPPQLRCVSEQKKIATKLCHAFDQDLF